MFVIDHNIQPRSHDDVQAKIAPVLQEWCEAGADLIEALGSPPKVVKASERLQKALLGY